MTRRIRGGGPASDELAAAVRWYENQRPGLGAHFYDSVAEATDVILAHPEAGSSVSADGLTRRVLVPGFPYQVVYRIRLDEIVIVAVAHLKRRPAYWRGRT